MPLMGPWVVITSVRSLRTIEVSPENVITIETDETIEQWLFETVASFRFWELTW